MILGWGWKRHVFFCLNDFRSGPLPTLRKILWDGERRWPDQRVPWSKLRGHVGTVGWIRPVSPWKSMDIHGSIPSRWGFSSCACADRSVPWCREDGASSGIFLINVRASLDIFRSSQESGYVHFLENHKGWGWSFRADSMQSVTFAWFVSQLWRFAAATWCFQQGPGTGRWFQLNSYDLCMRNHEFKKLPIPTWKSKGSSERKTIGDVLTYKGKYTYHIISYNIL